jgi:uncharacterized protein YciI
MAYAVLAFDGTDAEAPDRRAAALEGHVAFITAEAEAGRLALGLPLRDEGGRTLGSLMFLDVPDRAGVDAYLGGEPFAARGVWKEVRVLDFRIAPLPYAPWPAPGGPAPASRTHTVTIARDGRDPEAQSRRLAARPRHLERVRSMTESGMLVLGGAILDEADGAMTGSIAVSRHATHAEAEVFWAEDPYVREGVWKDLEYFGTAIRPLAYKPLPR